MKIRTQNIWIVAPLFLAVAALLGALMLFVQQRELKWGSEEEVSSIALSIARQLDADLFTQAALGVDVQWPTNALARVIQWDRARAISFWSLDGRLLFATGEPQEDLPSAPPAGADQGGWLIEPMRTPDGGETLLRAWSAVRKEDAAVGYVMVETSASDVRAAILQIRHQIRLFVILSGCSGLILAWILSGLISRRLRELTQTAWHAADGHYDVRHEAEGIQEISELGNTFNTMTSVLGEVVSKSRRVIVEAEQFRTERDLEHAYASQFFALRSATLDRIEVSGSLLSAFSAGHFFGFWTSPQGYAVAITGHMDASAGLASAIKAAAAVAALEELTSIHAWSQAVTIWRGIFNVPEATAFVWEPDSEQMRRFVITGADRPLAEASVPRPQSAPLLLHSLSAKSATRLRTYMEMYSTQNPETLVAEMKRIASPDCPGAVLVLKGSSKDPFQKSPGT